MDEKVKAMGQAMALLRQGKLDTKSLVTVYEFAEIEQAFQALAAGQQGLYKAVLQITQ
jgi:threonine dehydrogenase-like Zn-dependent dehydrogenase